MNFKCIPVGALQTNCFIVWDDSKKCAVIDPGCERAKIMDFIAKSGLTVDKILLTHGHYDHCMAAGLIAKQTGADIYIHQSDKYMLAENCVQKRFLDEPYLEPQNVKTFADGDEIAVASLAFKVLNTPGHTKGSCVLLCADKMFSGDTLFCECCGRTDLAGGDADEMFASLARLASLDGDYDVYPGHEEFSRLSHERAHNRYMRHAISL